MSQLKEAIQKNFQSGDLNQLQQLILKAPAQKMENGSQVISELIEKVDCVRYSNTGIVFQKAGLEVRLPSPDEVMILPTSVSLCGTDIDLIRKAQAGTLPPESIGKVVGHEAAGFVVGVGADVTDWKIGQMVCLDSHFSCGLNGHQHFNDCVHSGKGCDGIVGGIRGSLGADGKRNEPRDGYWSRLMTVPVSALPVELPVPTAKNLAAPSTLESLGNIYMIIGQLQQAKLLNDPADTLCVVSGLGATGYPLAAVAHHYGLQVVGIDPFEGKRLFAQKQGACQATFASTAELLPFVQQKVKQSEISQVVIAVMVGDERALSDALALLENESLTQLQRKACIVFGLFADAAKPMPMLPPEMPSVPERDFVFSRQHFTTAAKTEVYGVCGRDLAAWQTLMKDLEPDAVGQPPKLVEMLNSAMYQVPAEDPLAKIAEVLNSGADQVKKILDEHQATKLVANLMKGAQ